MKLSLPPSSALFAFTVFLSISVRFPAILCQETGPFDVCGQSVDCGELRLEYPFWGSDRPAYCGHPGFQLTCLSNVPILNYESVNYHVLDTDASTQTIIIARIDLWTTFCPQTLYNTSYNSTLFNGDNLNQQNVSLYYDCGNSIPGIGLGDNYRFTCTENGNQSDSYFYRTDLIAANIAPFLVQCENYITVPVNQSSATQLGLTAGATTDDLRSALTAGFQLKWTANSDECRRCIQSNGQCGSNSTSPDLFACYCASGNFSLTCNDTIVGGGK